MKEEKLIAMLGGGQLGLMFTEKAQEMGQKVLILDPDKDCPAGKIADKFINACFDDSNALNFILKNCNVCTTEFENIPYQTLEFLDKGIRVFPNPQSLKISQNRILEKSFLKKNNIPTTEYYEINSEKDIEVLCNLEKWPYILKTSTFGYDGKGQMIIQDFDDIKKAYNKLQARNYVLEKKVTLKKEVSQVAACYNDKIIFLPISENIHINNILHKSIVPADINKETEKSVQSITTTICKALNYQGIICIEFFIDSMDNVLVNEIAPRTHNSGHYSIEGCNISQFEHQVRILNNYEAKPSKLKYPSVMLNLLGDLWIDNKPNFNFDSKQNIFLHLYNKTTPKKGRKMGHITVTNEDLKTANDSIDEIFTNLKN